MFEIGDKVVYPMHGAGLIEDVEEKQILGQVRRYYILRVPFGDMKIMIPVDNCDEIGVRSIVSREQIDDVIELLRAGSSSMSDNWNKRFRDNMDKLKSGDIREVAEVVRNLMRTDQEKKLSTGEKKMLANAKQILISEIVLVNEVDQEAANQMINVSVMPG